MVPPTAQKQGGGPGTKSDPDGKWLARAQSAYDASTTYLDTNYRQQWDDAIRAFNSMHPNDSKYNNAAYEKRSRLYRPKTRTVIRKNEAQGAAAFFSNMDVVDVTGADQSNEKEVASATINKQLLQYRLTKSVKWFHFVLGGLQDAQTVGVACAHVHWRYRPAEEQAVEFEEDDEQVNDPEYPEQGPLPMGAFAMDEEGGEAPPTKQHPQKNPRPGMVKVPEGDPKPIVDKPVVDLIPVENLRIDPAADWTDPCNTSPYVIQLIPVYMMDLKNNMAAGIWLRQPDSVISAAKESFPDSTRQARRGKQQDPTDGDARPDEYDIIWVQRHIHRDGDEDWDFYTLGSQALLTAPRLLTETCPHLPVGMRPYVMGCAILEAHKVMPNGVPGISRGLQDETNDVANQRSDNVKFVLNKKWFVQRGQDVDIQGLVRNVPGGAVMMNDVAQNVREISWPDVTASAFEETQRLDAEFNDLVGNFSPAQMMQDHALNAPARNMNLLANSTGTLAEYLLRTYVETFIQPVLRQLLLLEQHYETDEVIIALAAKQAQLYQRFGIDRVTDDILEHELNLTVNVGMGATDPQMKLQKFMSAMGLFTGMMQKPVPGINMVEVGKEIFGHLGYQDGKRFFTSDNPQTAVLQQQLEQQQAMIQQLQMKLKEKSDGHMARVVVGREANQTRMAIAANHEINQNKRTLAEHIRALTESKVKLQADAAKPLLEAHVQRMQPAAPPGGAPRPVQQAAGI